MTFDGRVLGGLGVLAAVVETGSFVRAGASLGLTQSGVSRAIARLEERVGVRLLQRSARSVALTGDGRRFYEAVAPLMAGIEEAAGEAALATKKPKGVLRVSIDAVVARAVLGPRIPEFLAEYPDVVVDLVVRDRLGDLIADGFDLAVRFGDPEPSSLIARKLLDTRVVTCAAPAYLERRGRPSHPREVSRHECILFRDPRTNQPYEWIFQRRRTTVRVEARGRLIVNDSATAFAACAAGHGIAQPLELELRAFRGLGLVELFPDWADERFPLYVYYPSRRLAPAKVRAFVDFVAAVSR